MRFIKRFQPSNIKAEFLNDDTIEFDIVNNIVDMSSLKIYYEAFIDPVYKYASGVYLKRFMPRLSQSIIQELTVSVNNVPIQQIKEFNLLFNILNDGKKKDDDIHSDKIDTLQYSYINSENVANTKSDFTDNSSPAVKEPLVYKYFIDKFIGFINDVKYLDCRNKNVKISIKLAPKWITYRGVAISGASLTDTYDTNYKYRIRNVYANIDILTPDERVPIEDKITYQDFKYMVGVNGSDKNTYTTIKHTGNINYILSTFTDKNRDSDTGLQLAKCNTDETTYGLLIRDALTTFSQINSGELTKNMASADYIKILEYENLLNNSIYFKRNGLNIKYCQYRLNGQDITPLMNIMDIFNVAKEFFGDMRRVQSVNSFQNEFFCFPIKVGELADDMVSEIEWITNSDNKTANGGTPIMFICFDKAYQF